ncbi:hypothetical protein [Thioclava sp. SK-1]|uniref:hypothetical protein n=1 Tax=Thioclava sp. SK-1 TaxID=1889770 RepID=UPI00159EFAD4|nr:hypothetical protein [Thioclava sp. SK-1]
MAVARDNGAMSYAVLTAKHKKPAVMMKITAGFNFGSTGQEIRRPERVGSA